MTVKCGRLGFGGWKQFTYHMRPNTSKWRRGANTIVGGGDDNGQANDYDIIRTMMLWTKLFGASKSIEANLQIKGLYQA